MQFISAEPLIKKFRDKTFEESDVGSYFIAYMVILSVVMIFQFGSLSGWSIAGGIASVVITFFGVLHLKNQNGDSFGDNFLAKYFCLGWVVSIRMLLLSIPAMVVLFAMAAIVGGERALDPMGTICVIAYECLFYWWLGLLIEQSRGNENK